ncbi:MAG: Fic family protein [Geodermatophilaceae bacterium]|nr:Fic family protein [Geodermatophilaceae bacterium]
MLAQLDAIAPQLPARQVAVVRERLVAVLGTRTGRIPMSARLAARLAGTPFDAHRLDLLSSLVAELERSAPLPRPDLERHGSWRPFFEAYFSNYIEGTEFGVEEARRIVLEDVVPAGRPRDAHDVTATHRLIVDPVTAAGTPTTPEELLDIARARHAVLMAARPDKRPGMFKATPNFVGSHRFVEPGLLEGTLRKGFVFMSRLTDPLHRAVAIMFLMTECHPFDDGNGRVARLLANAELSRAGQVRLIIPTVFRNNYLAALSGTSRGFGQGQSLISVLQFAQAWTAAIDWTTYEGACADLGRSNAFEDPVLAEASGRRLRLPS